MLVQCLAVTGALYLISVFVAAVAVVVYFIAQYLKHSSRLPGPSLPPTLDSHPQSLGVIGCIPFHPLELAFALSYAATFLFIAGAVSAWYLTDYLYWRRHRNLQIVGEQPATVQHTTGQLDASEELIAERHEIEQPAGEQPNSPGYGTC